MPRSSIEVAMQTVGSLVSEYLVDKNGVPMISKDGLNQLVTEMFPHCKKEKISPGVYEIRLPLKGSRPGVSRDKGSLEDFQRARDGARSVDDIIGEVISLLIRLGLEDPSENINDERDLRAVSMEFFGFKIELALLIRS